MISKIAVFCGSSDLVDPLYLEAGRELGQKMASRKIELIYGGASIGLMGAVADGALASGGKITGVIPDFVVSQEIAHSGVQDLRRVASMHERKLVMSDLADAFIALPGGFGTLDELFEIITWRQIRLHEKPIGILNLNGYFDSLLQFADHAVKVGFVRAEHRDLILVENDVASLLGRVLGSVDYLNT